MPPAAELQAVFILHRAAVIAERQTRRPVFRAAIRVVRRLAGWYWASC